MGDHRAIAMSHSSLTRLSYRAVDTFSVSPLVLIRSKRDGSEYPRSDLGCRHD
jgi:hypothetical protein